MTEEFHYTKSRLAQLAIAVGLILLVAGLLLTLQSIFATTLHDTTSFLNENYGWDEFYDDYQTKEDDGIVALKCACSNI